MKSELNLNNVTPITDLAGLLMNPELLKAMDALDVSAMLKRAEVFSGLLRVKLLSEANDDFKKRYSENTPKMPLLNGKVVATQYTKKSTWKYPPAIVTLEAELNNKKKKAQVTGAAEKLTDIVNTATDATFSITLVESFEGV